jgi:hypothetical protein
MVNQERQNLGWSFRTVVKGSRAPGSRILGMKVVKVVKLSPRTRISFASRT